MKIINEDVQLIHISPTTKLTPPMITSILYRAMGNKMYAKFYTDKVFIQVNFAKDGTISVASNIRDGAFLRDYNNKCRIGWNFALVKSFIYQWMQASRSTIW